MKTLKPSVRRLLLILILTSLNPTVRADETWKGTSDNQWTTTGNWSGGAVPGATDLAIFNNLSTANFSNWLAQAFNIKGIVYSNVPAAFSINSTSTLTNGSGGINMTNVTQPLTISAPLYLGANQSWIVASNQVLTVPGVVSGTSGLYKDGFGTLILSGANTFTGAFTNNGGPVWINNSGALGTGSKTVYIANNNLGAGLYLNGTNGNISLASGLSFVVSQGSGAIFNETGNNVINGPMSVFSGGGNAYILANGGSLTLNGQISLGTTARAIQLGGTAQGTNNGAIISSSLAFNKLDAGTWTLNAVNTYGGVTTVQGGTLVLGPNARITNTPSITLSSNTLLDVSAVMTGPTNAFFLATNQVLAGSGTVTGNVVAVSGATIQPGSNLNPGTLTLTNNLTLAAGATNYFWLNTATTPGGGTNSLLNVGGNLDPQNARIFVSAQSPPTVGGTYVLLNYDGSKLSSFNSSLLADSRYTFTEDESVANLVRVTVSGSGAGLVWHGSPTSSTWDFNTTSNWNNNTLTFLNFDAVTFDDTSATNTITLSGATPLRPISVTFNANGNYLIQGTNKITGTTGLTQSGAGTLIISNALCDYTGPVIVNGGTLGVSTVTTNGVASTLGAGTNITLNGGTLQFGGARPAASSFNRLFTLGTNGGTILSTNGTFFIPNQISGLGSLTKTGSVQIILGDIVTGTLSALASNTYSGNTYVAQGELQIRNDYALGSGKAIVSNGADLAVGGGVNYISSGIVTNEIDLNGGDGSGSAGTLQVNDASTAVNFGGPVVLLASSSVGTVNNGNAVTFIISGPITGPGGLKKLGTNSVTLTCPTNSFSGGTLISSGTLQLGNGGTAGSLGAGPITNNAALTFNHTDTETISSAISGTGPLTHSGSGTLVLGGANTYSGVTTVSGGTLLVNGSLGANTVTVATNATFGGTGTIGGALTISNGATLALGASIGTMTISNSLTLNGTNIMKLSKTGVVLANDLLQGITTLSYGSTLNVTASGTALAARDTFQLFSAATYTHAFANISLPVLTGNLSWDTSGLAVSGTIRVVSPPAVAVSPAGPSIECGSNVTFTATTGGFPIPSLQWYDNTTAAIAGATNASYTLAGVHAAQNGSWSVVASNYLGKATNTALLTVIDTIPPVIACPSNAIFVVTTAPLGTNVSFLVTASDVCDPSPAVTSVPSSGSFFPAGTNTVVTTATDSGGNTNTCSFQVVVDRAPIAQTNVSAIQIENQPLILELTNLLAVASDPDGDPLSVVAADAASTNGGSISLTSTNLVYVPVTNFVGADLFSYVIRDGRGGLATNTVVLNIYSTNALAVAVTPSSTNGECGGSVSFTATTDGELAASFQWYDNLGDAVANATNAIFTLSDVQASQDGSWTVVIVNALGQATNSASLTVLDTTPPVITLNGPNPMTVECHTGYTEPGATANDTCAGSVAVNISGNVDANSPGTYFVIYTATDPSGNSATNTRTVQVVDTTPPVVEYYFTNLTVSATATNCQALLPDLTGTNYIIAVDNCSSVTVTQAPPAGTWLALGTNQVVLTALDAAGNSTDSTNTVVVVDTTPPAINCPVDIFIVTTAPLGTNVSFSVTASDACDPNPALVIVPASGSFFPAGTNTVTATATDSSGNSNTCSFLVVVDRAPVVQTNLSTYLAENQLLTLTTLQLTAVASDPDGDLLTLAAAGPVSTNGGIVTLSNSVVTYLPVTNYTGVDSFSYAISDGRGGFATNSVIVNVVSSNGLSPSVAFGPVITNGLFVVRFAGIPGYTYTVEATDDLGAPAWVKKTNLTAPSTDQGLGVGVFEFSESADAVSRFYRTTYPSY